MMRWRLWMNAPLLPGSASDMIIKIVSLFLIGMAVMAMFGKLRMPRMPRLTSRKCKNCGAPRVGTGPCPCGKA